MADDPQGTEEWLAEARAGSHEAMGQALEACRRYLLLVAQRELAPELQAKGGASDLVQQTFLEAQRDFPRFQGTTEAELLAWLRCILLHNLGKFGRQYRATKKRGLEREVALDAGSSGGGPQQQLAADSLSPSGHAIEREENEALQRAVERLPEDYRQVIHLRYREDQSFEQIAATMQRSVAAVRKLWARAVERLKQELEKPP
jgi:RNA polymerase sigma-70 factor (ECF subfamily)